MRGIHLMVNRLSGNMATPATATFRHVITTLSFSNLDATIAQKGRFVQFGSGGLEGEVSGYSGVYGGGACFQRHAVHRGGNSHFGLNWGARVVNWTS